MLSVSPACGLMRNWMVCACNDEFSVVAPTINATKADRIVRSESVWIVSGRGPQRRRRGPSDWLRRDDGPELREEESSHIRRTFAQRGIARTNDFFVFANADRFLHPPQRDRGIEGSQTARDRRLDADVHRLRIALSSIASAHDGGPRE